MNCGNETGKASLRLESDALTATPRRASVVTNTRSLWWCRANNRVRGHTCMLVDITPRVLIDSHQYLRAWSKIPAANATQKHMVASRRSLRDLLLTGSHTAAGVAESCLTLHRRSRSQTCHVRAIRGDGCKNNAVSSIISRAFRFLRGHRQVLNEDLNEMLPPSWSLLVTAGHCYTTRNNPSQ